MPKILYTSFDTVPAPKGAGVHISYFTKAMTEHGYNVNLFVPAGKNQTEQDFYMGAEIKRVKIEESNFLKRILVFSRAVEKEIEKNYDLVHFRSIWDGVSIVSKKNKSYKTLYEANGFPSIELPYHYPHLKNEQEVLKKIRLQEIICLKGADFIICPSGVIKNYITSLGIIEDKVKVIPNGVNTDIFKVYPMPSLPLNILYVGTLTPWQGINFLLDALYIMKEKGKIFILNILSDRKKKFERPLMAYASELNLLEYIKFLDPVEEEKVAHIISNSHICVSPLEYSQRNLIQGCCPLKILEYMSCGRPVVASDIACVREIIDHEIDGILCNTKEEMANSILRLAENPEIAEKIGIHGSVKAREKYTWHRAGEALLNTVDKLMSRNM
jgi:glycosyltransferase involved in cell wall biosynthesis